MSFDLIYSGCTNSCQSFIAKNSSEDPLFERSFVSKMSYTFLIKKLATYGATSVSGVFSLLLNLVVLEFGPHKEFRFIQNAIPILTLFAAKSINTVFGKVYHQKAVNWIISVNLLAIVYFSLIHQRGPVEVSR